MSYEKHLSTIVLPVGNDTQEEAVRKALKLSREVINEFKEDSLDAPVQVGGNLQEVEELIEANRDTLSADEIEMLRSSAQARQGESSVRRLPVYNWLHFSEGNAIKGTKPKQTALYANVGVAKDSREELGFDKWPLYPLKDNDGLPYYNVFITHAEPHYMIKLRNNVKGIECSSTNFTPSFLGGPSGTPQRRVPEIHGANSVENFCATCPHAPHNTTKDTDHKDKCRTHRVCVVYLVGQSAGADTDSKAKTSPVVVGPLLFELSGVMLYEFFKKPSPASGKYPKIDGLLKYRFYKEDIPKTDKFRKVAAFVGKEDGPKVIESANSMEKIYANLTAGNGLKWYKDLDERAKARHASTPVQSLTEQTEAATSISYEEPEYDEPSYDDDED